MKYYDGDELKWCAEDVLIRATDLGIDITEEEAESILVATFEDSDYIMEMIGEAIRETIRWKKEQ
jgi:protein-tyrosine-phosphatase